MANFSDWIDRELWGIEPEPVTIDQALVIVQDNVFRLPRRVVKYFEQIPQYKDAATANLIERPYTEDCYFETTNGKRRCVVKRLSYWIKFSGKFYHIKYQPGMSTYVTFWAGDPVTSDAAPFTFGIYNDYLPYLVKAIKHYGLTEIVDDELYDILV